MNGCVGWPASSVLSLFYPAGRQVYCACDSTTFFIGLFCAIKGRVMMGPWVLRSSAFWGCSVALGNSERQKKQQFVFFFKHGGFEHVSTCCCPNHFLRRIDQLIKWEHSLLQEVWESVYIIIYIYINLQENPVRKSLVKASQEKSLHPQHVFLSDRHQPLGWFPWYWDVLRLKKRVEGLVPSLNFLLAQTLKRDSCVQQDRDRGWLRWLRWLAWLGSDMGVPEGVRFELSNVPERSRSQGSSHGTCSRLKAHDSHDLKICSLKVEASGDCVLIISFIAFWDLWDSSEMQPDQVVQNTQDLLFDVCSFASPLASWFGSFSASSFSLRQVRNQ